MTLLEVILDSKELKRLIVKRSLEYNIPLRYLCKESGIEYNSFMRSYINAMDSREYDCTEAKFKKLLSVLGINVRYQFVINDGIDMVEKSKELNSKYEEIQARRRELDRRPDQVLNRIKRNKS